MISAGLEPLIRSFWVPHRTLLGVENLGQHLRVTDLSGQVDRFRNKDPTPSRDRRVAQQLAGQAGQEPSARAVVGGLPDGDLDQANKVGVNTEEPRPRRSVQGKLHHRILPTGERGGQQTGRPRPTPRGDPQGVSGLLIDHPQRGPKLVLGQPAETKLLTNPDRRARSSDHGNWRRPRVARKHRQPRPGFRATPVDIVHKQHPGTLPGQSERGPIRVDCIR
jgi:hypothetical protein